MFLKKTIKSTAKYATFVLLNYTLLKRNNMKKIIK